VRKKKKKPGRAGPSYLFMHDSLLLVWTPLLLQFSDLYRRVSSPQKTFFERAAVVDFPRSGAVARGSPDAGAAPQSRKKQAGT